MIRLRQIKVLVSNNTLDDIKNKCASKLRISSKDIKEIKIIKESIDSRNKPLLYFVYEVDVKVDNEDKILSKNKDKDIFKTPNEEYIFNITGKNNYNNIVIVGAGPSGLFAAYMLSSNGYKVTLIDRGSDVDNRIKDVNKFWKTRKLNTESNVQFGEGGAGTFSDGKLNTLVKDPSFRNKKVLEIFVENEAPEEILYESKPHIGTDLLVNVIKNMRNKIIGNGSTVRFNSKLTNINIINNKIDSITINDNEEIKCDILILGIGHSARDTFKMLYDKGIIMEPKPFAVGLRIMHSKEMINKSQYGIENHPILKAASYKLTHTCKNKRGVYTFCMCPGGYVVNSSSEEGLLAVNGMSNHSRDSKDSNAAIIVTVGPNDFGNHPLDGIKYQRDLEKKAYDLCNGLIPIQLYKDFKDNKESTKLGSIEPILKGDYKLANIRSILPNYISESIIEGIDEFGKKIKGYNNDDSILAGIESRTSSPVRINRDDNYECNIKGIYPMGEGAGYAGGITSAAMDGLKIAEQIAKKYKV